MTVLHLKTKRGLAYVDAASIESATAGAASHFVKLTMRSGDVLEVIPSPGDSVESLLKFFAYHVGDVYGKYRRFHTSEMNRLRAGSLACPADLPMSVLEDFTDDYHRGYDNTEDWVEPNIISQDGPGS